MNKFQSNAEWGEKVYTNMYGTHISTDKHLTEEAAQAVCDALAKEGFGGMGVDFPVRVWVSPVDKWTELKKEFEYLLARYDATFTQTYDGAKINFEDDTNDYYLP